MCILHSLAMHFRYTSCMHKACYMRFGACILYVYCMTFVSFWAKTAHAKGMQQACCSDLCLLCAFWQAVLSQVFAQQACNMLAAFFCALFCAFWHAVRFGLLCMHWLGCCLFFWMLYARVFCMRYLVCRFVHCLRVPRPLMTTHKS